MNTQTLDIEKKLYYFNASQRHSAFEFSETLTELIHKHSTAKKQLILLCIGTDRATGDSLGPLIGYKLSKMKYKNVLIYGTLENPVHAKNLKDTLLRIHQRHKNALIIAIDASLGKSSHIGYITLGEGSLKPGAGVDKELPPVGDIFITGIVNFSGIVDHMLLQTTRLNIVMEMADYITMGVRYSIYHLDNNIL